MDARTTISRNPTRTAEEAVRSTSIRRAVGALRALVATDGSVAPLPLRLTLAAVFFPHGASVRSRAAPRPFTSRALTVHEPRSDRSRAAPWRLSNRAPSAA